MNHKRDLKLGLVFTFIPVALFVPLMANAGFGPCGVSNGGLLTLGGASFLGSESFAISRFVRCFEKPRTKAAWLAFPAFLIALAVLTVSAFIFLISAA